MLKWREMGPGLGFGWRDEREKFMGKSRALPKVQPLGSYETGF